MPLPPDQFPDDVAELKRLLLVKNAELAAKGNELAARATELSTASAELAAAKNGLVITN